MVDPIVGPSVATSYNMFKDIFLWFKRKYKHWKNVHKNFKELEVAEKNLNARKDDIEGEQQRESLKEPTNAATTWSECVNEKMVDAVPKIKADYQQMTAGKCLYVICFFRVLNLSKKIQKLTKEMNDLKDQTFERLVPKKIARVEERFIKKIYITDSLKENLKELLERFGKGEKRIGITGMAGIGKTTLMAELERELVKDVHKFDIVIWVDVGRGLEPERKIRQVIKERLRIQFNDINSIQQQGAMISEALHDKKYVILLDGVFSKIHLHAAGIRDEHTQGKVVLTCRDQRILYGSKQDDYDVIKVQTLKKTDAAAIFQSIVGEEILNNRRIKYLFEQIVGECGGHPQVICAIAKSLRRVSEEATWRRKLTRLKLAGGEPEEMKDAINAYKVIFEENLNDLQKNCLKYGAVFSEDHKLHKDHLVECWKAQGFIDDPSHSFMNACDYGHDILNDLLEMCLFESDKDTKCVSMPIYCRSMARKMFASSELRILGDSHEESSWKGAKIVSFMHTEVKELQTQQECDSVTTLFLQNTTCLSTIPESFFNGMSNLAVLDLYSSGIRELPRSISSLINLKGLYLNKCTHLREIPDQIGSLAKLEVLDIRLTSIQCLPLIIQSLSQLKCLRVSFNSSTSIQEDDGTEISPEMFPSCVLASLPKLEELIIDICPSKPKWRDAVVEIAIEVARLAFLTSLCFYFPTKEDLKVFVDLKRNSNSNKNAFEDLQAFKIQVGFHASDKVITGDNSRSSQRHLRYVAGGNTCSSIAEVLTEAESFELICHDNAQSLIYFGIENIKELKICRIERCNQMIKILDASDMAHQSLELRELYVYKLERLTCLWEGNIGSQTLAKLTKLFLHDCSSIRKFLSLVMAQQLKGLEHLEIVSCAQLGILIEPDNVSMEITEVDPVVVLPKLKIMELRQLPALTSICSHLNLSWLSLERFKTSDCPKLQQSVTREIAPRLETEGTA